MPPNKNAYLDDLAANLFSGLSKLNQLRGYTYGNRLLQEVAWLIQETVKERGSVYRLGGPTFAVLSDTLSREETAAIYDMVRYRLQRGVEVNGLRGILAANGGLVDFNGSINYGSSRPLELVNTIRDCMLDECRGFAMEYEAVIDAKTEHRS